MSPQTGVGGTGLPHLPWSTVLTLYQLLNFILSHFFIYIIDVSTQFIIHTTPPIIYVHYSLDNLLTYLWVRSLAKIIFYLDFHMIPKSTDKCLQNKPINLIQYRQTLFLNSTSDVESFTPNTNKTFCFLQFSTKDQPLSTSDKCSHCILATLNPKGIN